MSSFSCWEQCRWFYIQKIWNILVLLVLLMSVLGPLHFSPEILQKGFKDIKAYRFEFWAHLCMLVILKNFLELLKKQLRNSTELKNKQNTNTNKKPSQPNNQTVIIKNKERHKKLPTNPRNSANILWKSMEIKLLPSVFWSVYTVYVGLCSSKQIGNTVFPDAEFFRYSIPVTFV